MEISMMRITLLILLFCLSMSEKVMAMSQEEQRVPGEPAQPKINFDTDEKKLSFLDDHIIPMMGFSESSSRSMSGGVGYEWTTNDNTKIDFGMMFDSGSGASGTAMGFGPHIEIKWKF
jgi:hypothetical protein